jgi:hypothetical protein
MHGKTDRQNCCWRIRLVPPNDVRGLFSSFFSSFVRDLFLCFAVDGRNEARRISHTGTEHVECKKWMREVCMLQAKAPNRRRCLPHYFRLLGRLQRSFLLMLGGVGGQCRWNDLNRILGSFSSSIALLDSHCVHCTQRKHPGVVLAPKTTTTGVTSHNFFLRD